MTKGGNDKRAGFLPKFTPYEIQGGIDSRGSNCKQKIKIIILNEKNKF